MNNFSQLLLDNPLFDRVPENHLDAVVQCLNGARHVYPDRTLLFHSGGALPCFGLVLRGAAEIFLSGAQGNGNLLLHAGPGELFGEALTIVGASDNLFEIYALENTEILFLTVPEFTSLKNCNCTYRFIVMENLLRLVAKANMQLMMKIQILTQGSLREKLLFHLSIEAKKQNSSTVKLPFGREKLAFYLGCDRSALSRELGRMKRDGIIDYTKNTVTLL